MSYPVEIIQVFKATRRITVWVGANSPEDAVEEVQSGAYDTPPFDHPDWDTFWDLQNEQVASLEIEP